MPAVTDFAAVFNEKVAERLKTVTEHAPYPSLLGIRVEEVGPGRVVCVLPVGPNLGNGVGTAHGGAISSLIDHTLSLAVYPLVEVGRWVATTEFKVNYLDAVKQGLLRATGAVVALRTRTAVVRVDVMNDDRPVATALGTLTIRDKLE